MILPLIVSSTQTILSAARMFRNAMPRLFGAATGPAGLAIADGVPYAEPSVPVMVIAGRPRANPMTEPHRLRFLKPLLESGITAL